MLSKIGGAGGRTGLVSDSNGSISEVVNFTISLESVVGSFARAIVALEVSVQRYIKINVIVELRMLRKCRDQPILMALGGNLHSSK